MWRKVICRRPRRWHCEWMPKRRRDPQPKRRIERTGRSTTLKKEEERIKTNKKRSQRRKLMFCWRPNRKNEKKPKTKKLISKIVAGMKRQKQRRKKLEKEDKGPVIYVKGNIISEIALTWLVCAKEPEEEVRPVQVRETRGLGCCAYTLSVPGR